MSIIDLEPTGVATDALPRRDELAVNYDQWATSAIERVSADDHRDVVRRYIRWHLQRRMNHIETVPHGTFLRSKQTVTVATYAQYIAPARDQRMSS
jgi:predicted ArsR family transcriptional regulator